jgi:hypothetical protein
MEFKLGQSRKSGCCIASIATFGSSPLRFRTLAADENCSRRIDSSTAISRSCKASGIARARSKRASRPATEMDGEAGWRGQVGAVDHRLQGARIIEGSRFAELRLHTGRRHLIRLLLKDSDIR